MVASPCWIGAVGLALAIGCGAGPSALAADAVSFVPVGDLRDPAQARDFVQRVTESARRACHQNFAQYRSEGACVAAACEEAFDQLRPDQRRLLGLSPWQSPWPTRAYANAAEDQKCPDASGRLVKCGEAGSQTAGATAASGAAKPAAARVGTPAGAIARCNDGTLWTSDVPHAACSRHGGVAEWM
jgi:UrcA family protein